MTAHAWLQETPWPTKQLPRQELEERIAEMLREAKEGNAERVLEIMSSLLPDFDGHGGFASDGRGRQRDR